jgi:predicted transglutaminase-like cysteine proteinase
MNLVDAIEHGLPPAHDSSAYSTRENSANQGLRDLNGQPRHAAVPAIGVENAAPPARQTEQVAYRAVGLTAGQMSASADLFDAVALPFSNLRMLKRWDAIASSAETIICPPRAQGCRGRDGVFSKALEQAAGQDFSAMLGTVNAAVNHLIAYDTDRKLYGRLDYWADPAETLSRGAGDCEDFAILKMAALERLGVPSQSMSLVVLRDRSRNVFHAVLAVATSAGNFILDIMDDRVRTDDEIRHYQPLYSLSAHRGWIYGTRIGHDVAASAPVSFDQIVPGEGPGLPMPAATH